MDFQTQIKYLLPTGTPMPYFMAYPENSGLNGQMAYPDYPGLNGQMAYPDYPCLKRQETKSEENAWQDFEYLRRTYPALLGKWQHRVEEILDRMDYEGSMIYDEYPDRLSLQNLGEAVSRILLQDEAAKENPGEPLGKLASNEYLQGLAQVLVCNEVYRRRQKRKQESYGRVTKDFGNHIE
ncbi:MAG: hypothetical protein IKO03_07670 [Lachnospiraceae bacterium]|nr:hypothetical protein [Lachnospiraceae bacterium]MBR3508625.1 hypothetical protein [Lachnospiraceae bacterium]